MHHRLDHVSTRSPEGLLTLLEFRGIGPHAAERLASDLPTLGAVRTAEPTELSRLVSRTVVTALAVKDSWEAAIQGANAILRQGEQLVVRLVGLWDPDYPALLKSLPDRPLVIYVRGQLRPGPRHVACIGTREPTRFGEEVTRRIVAFLAGNDWSVVSGLALGIDALAHRAALEAGGHTVAILANGLESVYPRKNLELADQIVRSGGAVISEQPFGTPAIPRHLVQRDRLQSGMSIATIPMQTDIVGGSMHTVRFTLLQRRLLVVPVPKGAHALEPKSRGILALAQTSGTQLADILNAHGAYGDLLRSQFAAEPPALPVRGREDYDKLSAALEAAASRAMSSHVEPLLESQPRLF